MSNIKLTLSAAGHKQGIIQTAAVSFHTKQGVAISPTVLGFKGLKVPETTLWGETQVTYAAPSKFKQCHADLKNRYSGHRDTYL
jgi:hypothetical protein